MLLSGLVLALVPALAVAHPQQPAYAAPPPGPGADSASTMTQTSTMMLTRTVTLSRVQTVTSTLGPAGLPTAPAQPLLPPNTTAAYAPTGAVGTTSHFTAMPTGAVPGLPTVNAGAGLADRRAGLALVAGLVVAALL